MRREYEQREEKNIQIALWFSQRACTSMAWYVELFPANWGTAWALSSCSYEIRERQFISMYLCLAACLINVEECAKKFGWMGLFLHKGILLITFCDYFDGVIIFTYGHSSYNFRWFLPIFKPIQFVGGWDTGNQSQGLYTRQVYSFPCHITI